MNKNIKNIITILGFVLFFVFILTSSEVLELFTSYGIVQNISSDYEILKEEAKKIISTIDEFGFYAKGEKWSRKKEKIIEQIDKSKNKEQRLNILGKAAKLGGGKHSFIAAGNNPKVEVSKQVQEYYDKPIETELIDNVLILKLKSTPNIGLGEEESANYMKRYIESSYTVIYNNTDINGFVIDLSDDTGGSMVPMILGLAPIIPDGPLFQFVDRDEKVLSTVFLEDGNMLIKGNMKSESLFSTLDESYRGKVDKPVAVVIGQYTASAAEMTLFALNRREDIVTFGNSTAGLTTGNAGYYFEKIFCWHLVVQRQKI